MTDNQAMKHWRNHKKNRLKQPIVLGQVISKYKNPWHKPGHRIYGPEFYETPVKPIQYKGYLIFYRTPEQWHVVKEGICRRQMAGFNGAKQIIDKMVRLKQIETATG